MLNQIEKKAVLKRLRYVKGQIEGIERMIDSNRSLQDIFIQLKAIEQGVSKIIYVVFEEQLKKHLAEVLSKRLAACPGNCSDAGGSSWKGHLLISFYTSVRLYIWG